MEFITHINKKLLTYDFWHHASFKLLSIKVNWPEAVTATVKSNVYENVERTQQI